MWRWGVCSLPKATWVGALEAWVSCELAPSRGVLGAPPKGLGLLV